MNRNNNDPSVRDRLNRLRKSIESCINHSGRVFVFGSRIYGMATEDSDVDLYFDTGNSILSTGLD